jgi:hypothetical protein
MDGGRTAPTGYVIHPTDWERIHLARLAKNPNNEAMGGAQPTLHQRAFGQSVYHRMGKAKRAHRNGWRLGGMMGTLRFCPSYNHMHRCSSWRPWRLGRLGESMQLQCAHSS